MLLIATVVFAVLTFGFSFYANWRHNRDMESLYDDIEAGDEPRELPRLRVRIATIFAALFGCLFMISFVWFLFTAAMEWVKSI